MSAEFNIVFSLIDAVLGATGMLQVELPDFSGGSGSESGSVGHLVAAAMQTAGIYAQSNILANFSDFLEKLAGLFYLASVIAAVMSVSMFGNYNRAAFLLIGPPLFYFMLTTTKDVSGATVQNGDRKATRSVEDQMRFLNTYVSDGAFSGNAKVSYFFVGFDRLVSSIVQGVVSVIIDTGNSEDIVVKARERVLSWALLAMPNDAAFSKLVSMGMMGDCAEIMRLKWTMLNHVRDPKSGSTADSNLDADGLAAKRRYDAESVLLRFELDHEVIGLLRKVPRTQEEFVHEKASCKYIWDETARIARAFAKKQLDPKLYLSAGEDDGTIPWDRVQREVDAALGAGANPTDVLAAYIIRNAMSRTTHAGMTSGIFNRSPFNAERRSGIFEDVGGVHRYGGFMRIQFFAKSIPYIQGIFLYVLTIAFPFFALFLVMPGRATTFVLWMSLWIWVKSWDIGFALVSVARKILWLFVRGGINKYDSSNVPVASMANQGINWDQPETIFSLISVNDPLATQNTYFTIVGILTVGVPFITAHFCLGATGLWDVFQMNLSQRGDYYFTRRMKQVSRTDYASNLERAQDEGRFMATLQGYISGLRDMVNGTMKALSGTGGGSNPQLQRPTNNTPPQGAANAPATQPAQPPANPDK